jgi:hypothetical protein
MKAPRYRATKKNIFAASLPDMPIETPLFVRDRCCYAWRDAALLKYPVNSRNRLSK